VQIQILANLLAAMSHDHDESLEALLDQTGKKPPENGCSAHFSQALWKTVRPWQQTCPRPRSQQEGRGDVAITCLAPEDRPKFPIAAISAGVGCCPTVKRLFAAPDLARRH
jgi:hypothetical protein